MILKNRMQANEVKNSKTKKSAKLKVSTLKRLERSTTDKPIVKLTKRKKTQTTKIKNEREEISTDVTEIKTFM